MLGQRRSQDSLEELFLWSGKREPFIDPKSFFGRFAAARPNLLRDEDFAHWYAEGKGRPSVPPSVVAGAFLLSLREGCSDREAEQRMRFDLRWKWSLGLGVHDSGCDHTSICVFRARLLAHGDEGELFKSLVQRAVDEGLLSKRAMQVMDSSPMLGAAAVQDTYKLIRTALHKLVKGHEKSLPAAVRPALKRYLKTGKADIDWNDKAARQRELQQLVSDAELALQNLPEQADRPVAAASRALLQQVARQDVEEGEEGGIRIRQGVAKDRVISTVDPDARHGHKSSAGRWNGYKKHVSVDPKAELITAVEVTAANVADGKVALDLLAQQQEVGLNPREAVADMAYAGAELRADAQAAGTTLVTRAAVRAQGERFGKADFAIDCEAGTVTCPAGQVATFNFRAGHSTEAVFAVATCAACPLASKCLSKPATGRAVGIHPHEDQLQAAAARRLRPDFDRIMRKRPTVERKQAHWNAKGGRRSRYMGLSKTRLQAFWSAAMVNLERMMVLGVDFDGKPASRGSKMAALAA
ncbi:MAG: IS1182 family transposase [Candidatus Dormibacteria bacterium]